MSTALKMLPAIGAHVHIRFESLTVECWVKDVKSSWGKPRLLIVPVVGTGEQWVELGRVAVHAPLVAGTREDFAGFPTLQDVSGK